MKFGGTSVEDAAAIRRTADIVAGRLALGMQPVVVVSAMARVTDQLLHAAAAAGRGDKSAALAASVALRQRHHQAAADLIPGLHLAPVSTFIDEHFDALDELLRGLAAVGEVTLRTTDIVASYGERLSSQLVAAAFLARGLPAVHVDARHCIITDNQHTRAIPKDDLIAARLREHVLPHAQAGRIAVLGGFIGSTPEGVTTTLGRGGSDFSAALIGGGLHAEAIEIWTDVNGIMTADPRICPDALRVRTIRFEEAAELAYFGAKVLHPATILPAVQKNIPVLVLNSRDAQNEGTRITALAPHCRSPFKSIAAKKRLTIIDIVANRMLMSHGYLRAVFEVFDRHKCSVDMVCTSEVSVSLTVDSNERLPEIAADLRQFADVKYEGRKALICMVGEDIRGHNGIAARVFGAVRHVNLRMISQGASEINMSFMIDEDDVSEAIRSLHSVFFADPDPEIFDLEARAKIDARSAAQAAALESQT